MSFLERNVGLAKGIEASTAHGQATAHEKWQQISTNLNSLGPPVKDAAKWKAVS